jgi:hypothetical protein
MRVLLAAFLLIRSQVVYIVFVPSLVFSSLSSTVTLKDIVSWFEFACLGFSLHTSMNVLGFDL